MLAALAAAGTATADWREDAYLQPPESVLGFGYAVAADGGLVLVGAPNATATGGGYGRAYLHRQDGDGHWQNVARLVPSDGTSGNRFGRAVAVGGETVVVGAWGDRQVGRHGGAAYVFDRNAGGADHWGQTVKLTSSDAGQFQEFGQAVAISGDTLVVGAILDDDRGPAAGAAYVFERNAGGPGTWGQVAKLTASDGERYDGFGGAVAADGDTIVVGGEWRWNFYEGHDEGSVYVFERDAGGPGAWGQTAILTASDAAMDDWLGFSVSISGETIVAGAWGDDDLGDECGSAYIFQRDAGGPGHWGQVAKVLPAHQGQHTRFGWTASVSGETVVVGSQSGGSAYIFVPEPATLGLLAAGGALVLRRRCRRRR